MGGRGGSSRNVNEETERPQSCRLLSVAKHRASCLAAHKRDSVGQVRAEAAAAVSVCERARVRACVLHCHVVRTARWTAGVSEHLVPCCTISSSNIKYPEGSQTRRRSDFFSCHDSPQKTPETAPARNSWVMDWKAVGAESVFDPPWGSAARSKWGLENEGCLCWAVRV